MHLRDADMCKETRVSRAGADVRSRDGCWQVVAKDDEGVHTIAEALGSGEDFKTKLDNALVAKGLKKSTKVTDPSYDDHDHDHDHDHGDGEEESSALRNGPSSWCAMLMAVALAFFW